MTERPLGPSDFAQPTVRLWGTVDDAMYNRFREHFDVVPDEAALVVVELSTLGGDPEVARMMGEDIRFASAMTPTRRIVFLGKAIVLLCWCDLHEFLPAREPLSRPGRAPHDP
jgi:hypothetical protein